MKQRGKKNWSPIPQAARELRLSELKEACELCELELKVEREKHELELKQN